MTDQPSSRETQLTWAAHIQPRTPTWFWDDYGGKRIASGTLVVAAGREGTGKSSFGIHLAAEVTRGALPGAFEGSPMPVFYCAVEDSWEYTIVPRLIAAGADLNRVARLGVTANGREGTLWLPLDLEMLTRRVEEEGPALIVIDPLMSVIEARINTHNEREVRQALDPLARFAEQTGAVGLAIAHFSKSRGSDASSLITGSGAFKNVPRGVFGFVRDETDIAGRRIMT